MSSTLPPLSSRHVTAAPPLGSAPSSKRPPALAVRVVSGTTNSTATPTTASLPMSKWATGAIATDAANANLAATPGSQEILEACEAFERRAGIETARYKDSPYRADAVLAEAPEARKFLVPRNDIRGATPTEPVTYFHSAAVPPISLRDFAVHMCRKYSCLRSITIAAALTLANRFSEATGLPITRLMMHRLFATCIHVAMKAHQDFFPSNADFGRTIEVSLREMNWMESQLVTGTSWRIVVTLPQAVDTLNFLAGKRAPSSCSSGSSCDLLSPASDADSEDAASYFESAGFDRRASVKSSTSSGILSPTLPAL